MVTFKGGYDKLYYTQHTFLNKVGDNYSFFFFIETNTHMHKGEKKRF